MENPEFIEDDGKNGDHFFIEDLLDFPNDDGMVADGMFQNNITTTTMTTTTTTTATMTMKMTGCGNSMDSPGVMVVDTTCNSPFAGGCTEHHFAGDNFGCRKLPDGLVSELCVPHEDLAELEWLSNFEEESFSSEDLQKLQLISGMKVQTNASRIHQYQPEVNLADMVPVFSPETSVPVKVRSKRPRTPPLNWDSRRLVNPSPTRTTTTTTTTPLMVTPTALSSSSESDTTSGFDKKNIKATTKKKESSANSVVDNGGEGRKCMHCATDKTPQWRTGPMGPKTLCNACGVRYKSGRLVPEYRPAASPTFTLAKHSNSHRKVLEIRRQKEVSITQQHQQQMLQQTMMFDVSNGNEYSIHQHIGPDFHRLIK